MRNRLPLGFLTSINAFKSFVGHKELNKIHTALCIDKRKINSQYTFRFANASYSLLLFPFFPLKTPVGTLQILISFEIVEDDIAVLPGIYVMGRGFLTSRTVPVVLLHRFPDNNREDSIWYTE